MKSEILSKEQNVNSYSQKNYYFIKYNEALYSFISNEIDFIEKVKENKFSQIIFFLMNKH